MRSAILARFRQERQSAIANNDPMAALLALATVGVEGLPEVRTLVLRELDDQLAVFINRTSPKWLALQAQPRLCFMTYWPSSQIQYRFDCDIQPIAKSLVDASWLLRAEAPRRLDQLYQQGSPQSSTIRDRQSLLERAALVPKELLTRPASEAAGLYLLPRSIERLHLAMNGEPHDRRCYTHADNWQEQVLMP